ncbi:serine/threonine protein kinase [Saprolegnia diclina VS20]|uniref:Serine/threonine protein kinase n=1 Tax=Saprolegnia diclina (strain VS20) TaxID=1156394 RepID=T0QVY2_SAPDV|nr:serine/threonine protein kinase [Saprolegnia diclina VS20]EQC42379.1 serine/threonine protein kinase [Saprolegnia diclina VS20]|eukprot:XP_008603802.1 serine/threonine protein kinase [Saprolegnia diclina VS20]
MDRYTIDRVLAPALYGDVVLARDAVTGDRVAIKRMKLEAARRQTMLVGQRPISEDILFEKHVNRALSADGGHTNVLRMRDDFTQDGYEHFVLDFCAGGELYDVVSNAPGQRLALPTATAFFRQIVRGVAFMHSRGFAHRDLSLENVLVDGTGICHICDFGLAASLPSLRKEAVGKTFYMAPEVLAGQSYDPAKADMWSLGIMLFIMLAGIPPVEVAAESDSRFRVIRAKGVVKLLELWKMTHFFDADALDLLGQLLHPDATARLSLDALLHHAFVVDPSEAILHIADIKITTGDDHKIASDASTKRVGLASAVMHRFKTIRRPSSRKITAAPLASIADVPTALK